MGGNKRENNTEEALPIVAGEGMHLLA